MKTNCVTGRNLQPWSKEPELYYKHLLCVTKVHKARNTLAPRQAAHRTRQPRCAAPRCNVICHETKNANLLMRGVACSQLIRLVWHSPRPVLTLMGQQPMKAVHACQNWAYTLAHHGTLRLLRVMHSLPRCKRISGFTDSLHYHKQS